MAKAAKTAEPQDKKPANQVPVLIGETVTKPKADTSKEVQLSGGEQNLPPVSNNIEEVTATVVGVKVVQTNAAPDVENPDNIKPVETVQKVEERKEPLNDEDDEENETLDSEDSDSDYLAEKMAPYLKAYPKEKVFHITSDGQVFLDKDKGFAKEHQATLENSKELQSFEVKN